MEFFADLSEYCYAVFLEAKQKILTAFSILGVFLFTFPELAIYLTNDIRLVRVIAGFIVFLSFFIANFSMYRKLADRLSHEADIRLEVQEYELGRSYGTMRSFPEPCNTNGFDSNGMPDWASLWAKIKIANIGFENGRLSWQIDKNKTQFPPIFNLESFKVKFFPPDPVTARKNYREEFYLEMLFTVRDPEEFARQIKLLVESKQKYEVVLLYRTERVNSASRVRKISIKGDFQHFHNEICHYWQGYNFEKLVKLAQ